MGDGKVKGGATRTMVRMVRIYLMMGDEISFPFFQGGENFRIPLWRNIEKAGPVATPPDTNPLS